MDEIASYIEWRYCKMYYTLKIEFEDFVKSVTQNFYFKVI